MGDDYGKSIIPFPEGGYLILGTTTQPGSKVKNVFLARIEEDISNPVWIQKYGGQLNHVASCMRINDEGNIVITGTQEISEGNHVIFLLETDNNGNQLYLRTYGGQGRQRGAQPARGDRGRQRRPDAGAGRPGADRPGGADAARTRPGSRAEGHGPAPQRR